MISLQQFVFYYPAFMGLLWISGAIVYFLKHEFKREGVDLPPPLPSYPPVSIIVPCYNEFDTIGDTINSLSRQNYPCFDVIAVNDGSTDNTHMQLNAFEKKYSWLRVIHLKENSGKASCLNVGFLASNSEFIVCVDADTLLDRNAIGWMMGHFLKWPKVGAVTGNPRIRNSTTSLLARIQVGEFSAIVGMIKRTQRIFGKVFSVSGVISGFRKKAVFQAGMWDSDTVTEDIDMTWKLQKNFWDVRFEPRALCHTLMPETISGLWKQRVR
ncbi:MAG: glycosyltransferase [Nitrospinota bacterium]